MIVREALVADLPAVLELYSQLELDGAEVLSLEEARQIYDRMTRYPDYRLYVAEIDGRIVGTFTLIVMENLAHGGARSGLVESVVVAPGMRRRGVGTAMMAHARAHCREHGCYKMALSSNRERERAHAFYDALGFERHGFSFRVAP
jgi:GNAT superfamily N-acetyltransferase